jgi:hypothetical protein
MIGHFNPMENSYAFPARNIQLGTKYFWLQKAKNKIASIINALIKFIKNLFNKTQ